MPEAIIQIALEACDAIRSLLGSLTHNRPAELVSSELLQRLGVGESTSPRVRPRLVTHRPGKPLLVTGGRDAAFLNTASQCVETISGCFQRMEDCESSRDPCSKPISAVSRHCRRPRGTGTVQNSRTRWCNSSDSRMPR